MKNATKKYLIALSIYILFLVLTNIVFWVGFSYKELTYSVENGKCYASVKEQPKNPFKKAEQGDIYCIIDQKEGCYLFHRYSNRYDNCYRKYTGSYSTGTMV